MFREPLHSDGGGSLCDATNRFDATIREAPARQARASVFGDAPALVLEPELASTGPHAVNLRWLAGTVLAGVGGATLLAASLLVALDGQANFATGAKLTDIESPSGARGDGSSAEGTKGDKTVSISNEVGAKQTATMPDTITIGNREVIKTRQFTRVSTPLLLAAPSVADQIPVFDPLKMVASASAAQAAPDYELENADVAMIKTGLSGSDPVVFAPASLTDQDATTQIAATSPSGLELALPSPWLIEKVTNSDGTSAVMGNPANGHPAEGHPAEGLGSFSSIDVKVVPENVTSISKDQEHGLIAGERLVVARRGESFEQILSANGATGEEAKQIKALLAPQLRDVSISPGQKLRLLVAEKGKDGARPQLLRVVTYADNKVNAIVATDDAGIFRAVVPPVTAANAATALRAQHAARREVDEGPTVYESVYATALKNNIPRQVIDALVRVFAYDVDFQARARTDDSFDVLYAKDDNGANPEQQDVLYAKLTIGDEVRTFYRYQGRDSSQIEYFDKNGKSANKFLLRKPIEGGSVTSPFGVRSHPMFGRTMMHTGVDWGSPTGTPIFASGNGTVIRASYDSGNGNRVEVEHTNGYVTGYDHMSAYAKGIAPGVKVRQGQVIGFVGSTGHATGPHLHYEVIINGQFYDPLRIKLPQGRELNGGALAEFEGERRHIDDLLQRIDNPARLAQTSIN
ncbi:Murein DD-endopeptidase MepM and murein hydrolase activator NlpD, contain LysM domain [Rhizobiales bacterium GAS191]|nr:Murein DD-endopeptidase MepM and murein hydrolase activator NlpD, contain LysM domain [Rhizobiales bacterium GAS113]SEE20015.1 Murein DD-endopeptidase MepM and murein hydrolase activator NlpD, contain LysM domain [Rhizobiales bacterium GAS191]